MIYTLTDMIFHDNFYLDPLSNDEFNLTRMQL